MMTTTKNRPGQRLLRIGIALSLTFTLFFAGAFTTQHPTDPIVVVIDPGHGGKDSGATSGQLLEKDVALEISKMVANMLESKPVKIILTRENDKSLTLMQRIEIANYHKPDLFLSVHVNGKMENGDGLNAFFYEGSYGKESENYSKLFVANSIDGFSKSGSVLKADFFVLKNAQGPSVLLEMGSSAIVEDQQLIANSIAETIVEIQKGK